MCGNMLETRMMRHSKDSSTHTFNLMRSFNEVEYDGTATPFLEKAARTGDTELVEFVLDKAFENPSCWHSDCPAAFDIPEIRQHLDIVELLAVVNPRFTENRHNEYSRGYSLSYCFLCAIWDGDCVAMRMLDRWPHDIDVNYNHGARNVLSTAAAVGGIALFLRLLE